MNEKIKKEFAAGLIKLLDADDATAKKIVNCIEAHGIESFLANIENMGFPAETEMKLQTLKAILSAC